MEVRYFSTSGNRSADLPSPDKNLHSIRNGNFCKEKDDLETNKSFRSRVKLQIKLTQFDKFKTWHEVFPLYSLKICVKYLAVGCVEEPLLMNYSAYECWGDHQTRRIWIFRNATLLEVFRNAGWFRISILEVGSRRSWV